MYSTWLHGRTARAAALWLSLRRSSARNVASQRRLFTTPCDVASGTLEGGNHYINDCAPPAAGACVPAEALAGAERQRHFRQRRQRDPLGEGQPCTWRTLLIKVAAEVIVRTRRIVVRLSSSWPHLDWYRRVCERLRAPPPDSRSPSFWLTIGQPVAVPSPGGGKGAVCLRAPSRPKSRELRARCP